MAPIDRLHHLLRGSVALGCSTPAEALDSVVYTERATIGSESLIHPDEWNAALATLVYIRQCPSDARDLAAMVIAEQMVGGGPSGGDAA